MAQPLIVLGGELATSMLHKQWVWATMATVYLNLISDTLFFSDFLVDWE